VSERPGRRARPPQQRFAQTAAFASDHCTQIGEQPFWLIVDSQTLWDQLHAIARHLEPTYDALGCRVLEAPVINVDETRWPIMGSPTPAKGTVWGVRSPTISFYRILPGKSAEEGRYILAGYRGTVVADGFAVYEVLARDGPAFTLAHCWAHAKPKYDEIAERWPSACAEIGALIGELYTIERLVPGPFPGDAVAALFYTLCETAKLVGVNPNAYLLRALYTAIARPGAITFPEGLLGPTLTP
jgi:hypothetical protein